MMYYTEGGGETQRAEATSQIMSISTADPQHER